MSTRCQKLAATNNFPAGPGSTKSWFQNRTERRNETQTLQGARLKTGCMPVEAEQRRSAKRIGSGATGGSKNSS